MRAARNVRNLNDNREVEIEIGRYKKKKRKMIEMSKIQNMTMNGTCTGVEYYNTCNN